MKQVKTERLVKGLGLSLLVLVTASACGDSSWDAGSGMVNRVVQFSATAAVDDLFTIITPVVPEALTSKQRQIIASPSLTIDGVTRPISFTAIVKSGDAFTNAGSGSAIWGQAFDFQGNPLPEYSGMDVEINKTQVSYYADHSTLLKNGNKLFSITQFEERNGFMYITELAQDATTGKLSALASKPVDLSAAFGGYSFCAGMPTPWGTHLGGEEYPVDAKAFELDNGYDFAFDRYLEYWGLDPAETNSTSHDNPTRAAALAKTSVYRVGYPVEVAITGTALGGGKVAANTKASKHYSMGRLAWELAYVMPNQKTVYAGDDGAKRGMFRFEADKAGDLSSGKLYAAKLTQTSAADVGTFTITWKDLGSASDNQIDAFIKQGIQFSDMFETAAIANNACPAGFNANEADSQSECIKLKTSNRLSMTQTDIRTAASRLEALRFASINGATTEFNKFEGVTFDAKRNKLYIAVSAITGGMSTSPTLAGINDDIKLTENKCGAVYQLNTDANYISTNMSKLVMGSYRTYKNGQQCDIENIGMPDNVAMGATNDMLLIAEDADWSSSNKVHQNDSLWAYDLNTGKHTRILSTPFGAEVTSPFYYHDINGFDYIMVVVQHPYNESDSDQLKIYSDADSALARRAQVGYIGPIPVIK